MKSNSELDGLVTKIVSSLAFAKVRGLTDNNPSWTYQEGVLLSYHEAEYILEMIKQHTPIAQVYGDV
jgi:hypothetical protein